MNILNKFLKKIGRSYEELNTSEKAVYNNWQKQLAETGKPITIDNLINFLEKEIENELNQLLVPKNELNSKTDMFLKAQLKNNRMLLAFLLSPQKGRELLKEYLETKLENIKK